MKAVVGDNAATVVNGGSTTVTGTFRLSATETLKLQITNTSNVDSVANQGNTVAENTFLYLQKV